MATTVAYRHSDWPQPLRPFPPSDSGRFHRSGGRVAHYWSLHPHGPWAEWLRFNGTRDGAELLRRRTWAAHIDVVDPVRIGFDEAARWGITADGLVADEHTACRNLAGRLVDQGVDVIVVPSAALPGTDNLVLFGDRAPAPYGTLEVDVSLDVPCATTADDGRAQPGIAELVRLPGEPHAAYDAWVDGREFSYPQPTPTAVR